MDPLRFSQLVEEALERLPRKFKRKLENLAILVEDRPEKELQRQYSGILLGLFRGVPRTHQTFFAASPPAQIILYQKNIEAICRNDEEVRDQIETTVKHEIGHYFGMSERDLRRQGY
jgi:predicted Zn-dependent protease with MMP-like domain